MEIAAAADKSIKYQPNIVVINVGTNDCMQNCKIDELQARYRALLDKLFSQIPGVTIILTNVLPGTVQGIVDNRGSVNEQIRALVSDTRYNEQPKVVLTDVDAPATVFTKRHFVSDGIHLNDDGHKHGLYDMLCISPNGDAHVSINNYDGTFMGPQFWKSNEGSPQAQVRLADIDGDGRADYCTIADNGDITCWGNWGSGDLPVGWNPLGVVSTAKGMRNVDGVCFAERQW
ncbi:carbohydrate esterase family 3 protein [Parathielavia appendiculata]|uniref:Carbohydrate esterase family 3 protein n=1 Tax=Parathielavia appendiculata TaxID=2587402 RepID=A0AAN6U281_9PEZI|nr:carbohydrate esterase family 3 protein [Parathielavia appendiculata]